MCSICLRPCIFWCVILGFRVAFDRPESGFTFLERPEGAQGREQPEI
jgi:hypothetical protein